MGATGRCSTIIFFYCIPKNNLSLISTNTSQYTRLLSTQGNRKAQPFFTEGSTSLTCFFKNPAGSQLCKTHKGNFYIQLSEVWIQWQVKVLLHIAIPVY